MTVHHTDPQAHRPIDRSIWAVLVLSALTFAFSGGSTSALGLAWSLWHLPLFVLSMVRDQVGQSLPTHLVQVAAFTVAMAWLMRDHPGRSPAAGPDHTSPTPSRVSSPAKSAGLRVNRPASTARSTGSPSGVAAPGSCRLDRSARTVADLGTRTPKCRAVRAMAAGGRRPQADLRFSGGA